MEPITIGQIKAFTAAFQGHPQWPSIREAVSRLTKQQAGEIITVFHGTRYESMKAASEEVRENAKLKIPKALEMLESHGFSQMCYLCRQPRKSCSC